MHDSALRDVASLRNVVAFAVLTHTLDLITTQWRDPGLNHEGNPFYQFVEHLGGSGWHWLVITKVVLVTLLGLGFRWYLDVRPRYLPDRVVTSPRSLIWYGMWDRKPYPSSLWARLFNRRKFAFLGVALGGMALAASGAAALFISVDNALVALGQPLPLRVAGELLLLTIILVFIWWYWAYWHYYRVAVHLGLVPRGAADPSEGLPGVAPGSAFEVLVPESAEAAGLGTAATDRTGLRPARLVVLPQRVELFARGDDGQLQDLGRIAPAAGLRLKVTRTSMTPARQLVPLVCTGLLVGLLAEVVLWAVRFRDLPLALNAVALTIVGLFVAIFTVLGTLGRIHWWELATVEVEAGNERLEFALPDLQAPLVTARLREVAAERAAAS